MSRGRPTPNPAVEDASGGHARHHLPQISSPEAEPTTAVQVHLVDGACALGRGWEKSTGRRRGFGEAHHAWPDPWGLGTVSFTSEGCFSSDKGSRLLSPLQPWTTGCPGWGQAAPRHLLAGQLGHPRAPLAEGAGVSPQQLGMGTPTPPMGSEWITNCTCWNDDTRAAAAARQTRTPRKTLPL